MVFVKRRLKWRPSRVFFFVTALLTGLSSLLFLSGDGVVGAPWPDYDMFSALGTTSNLLLSVPFYVYDDMAWTTATFGNVTMEELSNVPQRRKHFDDFFFMKSSLVHPMRTHDPSKAKLYVIPLLLNAYAERHFYSGNKYRLCYRANCDRKLFEIATHALQESEWLRRYPERHIVVQSHYLANLFFEFPNGLKDMLYQVNAISFEYQVPNHPDRLRFPKLYVGNPCPMERKTTDVSMIANVNKKKLHYFGDRINICTWILKSIRKSNAQSIRMSQCGHGQQCPALAQAKYGFHARGDTLGSNRLLDTLLSGTVPIFTMKEQYDILPTWLDWRKLSVLLPLNDGKNETQFLLELEAILADDSGYRDRHRAVLQHRDLLDWHTLHPFDLYMYSLQAELYPATRHRSDFLGHVYPALNLPPPVS